MLFKKPKAPFFFKSNLDLDDNYQTPGGYGVAMKCAVHCTPIRDVIWQDCSSSKNAAIFSFVPTARLN